MAKRLINARIDDELYQQVENSEHKTKSQCVETALKSYFEGENSPDQSSAIGTAVLEEKERLIQKLEIENNYLRDEIDRKNRRIDYFEWKDQISQKRLSIPKPLKRLAFWKKEDKNQQQKQ